MSTYFPGYGLCCNPVNLRDPVTPSSRDWETQAHVSKACETICPKCQKPSSSSEFSLPFCLFFTLTVVIHLSTASTAQPSVCCVFIFTLTTDESQHLAFERVKFHWCQPMTSSTKWVYTGIKAMKPNQHINYTATSQSKKNRGFNLFPVNAGVM